MSHETYPLGPITDYEHNLLMEEHVKNQSDPTPTKEIPVAQPRFISDPLLEEVLPSPQHEEQLQ